MVFPIPSTALPPLSGTVQTKKVKCGNEITCDLAVVSSFQLKAALKVPGLLVFSITHVFLKDYWKQVLKNLSFIPWSCFRFSSFPVNIYIGGSFTVIIIFQRPISLEQIQSLGAPSFLTLGSLKVEVLRGSVKYGGCYSFENNKLLTLKAEQKKSKILLGECLPNI